MDNDTALDLWERHGKLLVLGLPKNSVFGIDCASWTVSAAFRGIKFIPPGLHFIYWSSPEANSESATPGRNSLIRCGCFLQLDERQTIVRQYDQATEDLLPLADADQNERYLKNIRDFDAGMGLYPQDESQAFPKWNALTLYISESLVKRVLPRNGRMTSMSGSHLSDSELSSAHSKSAAAATDAEVKPTPDDNIRFTSFNLRRSWPHGATGETVTRYSQDKSWLLTHVLASNYNDDYRQLLGELQLAFVLLLFGHNFEGLEQWKLLVTLLCSCEEVLLQSTVDTVGRLYTGMFDVMQAQLRQCPEDFFTDVVSENNFLAPMLERLFFTLSKVERSPAVRLLQPVVDRGSEFRAFLGKHFRWQLRTNTSERYDDEEEEDEEYRPVVVEL
ncbi:hypothetical protein RI367_006374 [Sorochytrium milnesiophthora]